ncbi:hypothetical protein [uncultured Nocardioides sp.]|uniref:hypothetical protein n=1 Tax=uncultured Nocardioides sp. TaxID=198441 RepID=UPI00262C7F5C|nr:hypothetical protein [uncultured Nocardioides sp.]
MGGSDQVPVLPVWVNVDPWMIESGQVAGLSLGARYQFALELSAVDLNAQCTQSFKADGVWQPAKSVEVASLSEEALIVKVDAALAFSGHPGIWRHPSTSIQDCSVKLAADAYVGRSGRPAWFPTELIRTWEVTDMRVVHDAAWQSRQQLESDDECSQIAVEVRGV